MGSELPLVGESVSTGASRLSWNASFKACFNRKLDAVSSALTGAKEFIQLGNRFKLESLPDHLKIGNTVEMIEDDGCTFVKATIEDISISDGMILVKSNPDASAGEGNSILLQRDKVRPEHPSSGNTHYQGTGTGPHPNFIIYDFVDVLISGKWKTGVIVQSPTSNGGRYRVCIFREKEKVGSVVTDTAKMRPHLDWHSVKGWKRHAKEPHDHPLNQSVGLVGSQRAKIVQMLDHCHAVVEFNDLTDSDGTHVKEVIHIKNWDRSRWVKGLKKLRYWLSPANDPVREFECYMPVYTCLAMFAAVSPVLFVNSAENWPDNMVLVFYLLGGLCCFLPLLLVVGVTWWQPTTRARLCIWRVLCLICVTIGVVFLAIHAVYGRQALVASRV